MPRRQSMIIALLTVPVLLSACTQPPTDPTPDASGASSSASQGADQAGQAWVPAGQDASAELGRLAERVNQKAATITSFRAVKVEENPDATLRKKCELSESVDLSDPAIVKYQSSENCDGEKTETILIGDQAWMRSKQRKWEQISPGIVSPAEGWFSIDPPANSKIVALGESAISGTKVRGYEVNGSPQDPSYKMQLYVDPTTNLVLRRTIQQEKPARYRASIDYSDHGQQGQAAKFEIKPPR